MAESRKLAAILAADVVGFSRLAGADEDRTLARLRALRSDLLDPTVAVHNGRVVKRTGEGALVALECFERAVALEPYFPDIWLQFRAQALYQVGRYPEAVGLLKRRILRNPATDSSRALLAASYGQMGMAEEARAAWGELMRVNPAYSIEQRRKVLPYKNPDDFERFVEGLRNAGLPGP